VQFVSEPWFARARHRVALARRAVVELPDSADRWRFTDEIARKAHHDAELLLDAVHAHELRVIQLEVHAAVRTTSEWIEGVDVADDDLVSVVLCTRNRSALVPRAIRSVQAQTYARWELVVIDDGSNDDTVATVKEIARDDDRIRLLSQPASGLSRARNHALDHLVGDIVVYVDDDNRLDPGWIKAVVWAFRQRPEADVLYGARLVDDGGRVYGNPPTGEPLLHLEQFDRTTLERRNLTDIGCIAHRSTLTERFDERVARLEDWDFLRRATRYRDPLVLPVVAVHYSTAAPGRISDDAG
jgi:hypothetical protein